LAEISRLAILPGFRPKLAVLGLLRAILQLCVNADIYYLYVAIDPRIVRILDRMGIQLLQISPTVNYHNESCPCYFAFVQQIIESVRTSNPAIWEVLTNNGEISCDYKIMLQDEPKDSAEQDSMFI